MCLVLPNNELHKSTLKSGDFYTKLSTELKATNLDKKDLKTGVWSVILATTFSDLATPGWLQNIFEKNIDATSNWLTAKNDKLDIYIPTKDIELSVTKKIDSQTQNLGNDVATCDISKTEQIKSQGYSTNSEFCLPPEVKNGSKTLSEFLNLSRNNLENQNNLSSLVSGNSLNTFSDKVPVTELTGKNDVFNSLYSYLNKARDSFVFVVDNLWIIINYCLVMFLLQMITAKLAGKKILTEIYRFCFFTVIGVFSLSFVTILSSGLLVYLNSYVSSLFFPSLATNTLVTIISLEVVKFVFNLLSVALWTAMGLSMVYVVTFLLEKYLVNTKTRKNQNYVKNKLASQNPTLDGHFQSILKNQTTQQSPLISNNPNGLQNNPKPTIRGL